MRRQLYWFGLTGSAAAATHWLVVVALVEAAALSPLHANVAGFGLAFLVSYGGHRRLAFRAAAVPHRRALPRFLAVALAGWVLNQGLYAWLLQHTAWPYPLALAAVLLLVAALTFLLARGWAFAGPRRTRADAHLRRRR